MHWFIPNLASIHEEENFRVTPPESLSFGSEEQFRRWQVIAGLLLFFLPTVALFSWWTDQLYWASFGQGLIPMAPSSALCFLALSLALLIPRSADVVSKWERATLLPTLAVAVFSLIVLLQLLLSVSADIERFLLPAPSPWGQVVVGRMSPLTATGFLASALALAVLTARRRYPAVIHLSGVLASGAWGLALVVILGYVYATPILYGAEIIPMALTTALAMLCLAMGVFFAAGREAFPLHLLVGPNLRDQLLRAFLPILPVLLMVDGLLYRIMPIENPALKSAILVLLTSAVIVALVYLIARRTAERIERMTALRVAAERQIDQQRAELQEKATMLELANTPIFSLNLDGSIRFWNKACQDCFGYSREEAEHHNAYALLKPQYESPQVEIEEAVLRLGTWEGEGLLRRKDGTPVNLLTRWALQENEAGQACAMITVNVDLGPQKEAARKLEAQLQRTQLLNDIARAIAERHDIESIFRVVMHQLEAQLPIDFGGVFIRVETENRLQVVARGPKSRELARQIGLEEGKTFEVISEILQEALTGKTVYLDDLSTLDDPLAAQYAQLGLQTVVIVPLIVDSEVQGLLTALRHEARAFAVEEIRFLEQLTVQVAVAMQDARQFLALVRAYDELQKTQDAMLQQERLRALGQMAGGITHDINNALSPIVGYSDLLLSTEENLSDDGRNYLSIIRTAAYDIGAIIARLREFYRQKEDSQQHRPVDLNVLAQHVIELTSPRWKDASQQRHITIRMEKDLCEGACWILGAESEIREALLNLVINSLDALQSDGEIAIRTRREEGLTIIEVADTGVGMDEDTQRRCLEPFFTTKGDRGTGLGLGMVFGVMKRHQGHVQIDSAPNEGATVRMVFPALEDKKGGHLPETMPTFDHLPSLRVLYIDDEPHLRELVKRMIEVDGHTVTTADGGQAGIDAFTEALESNTPFDLVISDLGMPYVGGRQVAKAVRAMAPHTPVMLLTGWGNRLNAEGDIPSAVDLVLSKPPKLETLREALRSLCKKRDQNPG